MGSVTEYERLNKLKDSVDSAFRRIAELEALVSLQPTQRPRTAGGGGSSSLAVMEVVSVDDDYIICLHNGSEVKVAKNWWLRAKLPFTELTYSREGEEFFYISAQERIRRDAVGVAHKEHVRPLFVPGDMIVATFMPSGGTDVTYENDDGETIQVVWLDVNDTSRQWFEIVGGGGLVTGGIGNFEGGATATAAAYLPDAWRTVISMPIDAKDHVGTSIAGVAYFGAALWGGNAGERALFAFRDGAWSRTANPTIARTRATAESSYETSQARVYLMGGQDSSGMPMNLIESYRLETDSWNTHTSQPLGYAAYYLASFRIHTAAGDAEVFHVLGGRASSPIALSFNFRMQITEAEITTAFKQQLPSPREEHMATHFNNDGLIIGGFNNGSNLSDTRWYISELDTWLTIANFPRPVRDGAAFTLEVNGAHEVYVAGGFDGVVGQALESTYKFSNFTWTAKESMPPIEEDGKRWKSAVAVV